MIEIRIKHHPKAADEWRFEVINRGRVVAYSRNFYTRRHDAMRGAERLLAGIFQDVRITEKGK